MTRGRKPSVLPTDEVRAAYEAGEGLADLGARFGVSANTVRRHLEDAGVAIRTRGGSRSPARAELPMDEIVAAYAAGESVRVLGPRYGVSYQTIINRLRAEGVTIRVTSAPVRVAIALPVDELVAAYAAGSTTRALAERYGVSESTIVNRLRDAGATPARSARRPR